MTDTDNWFDDENGDFQGQGDNVVKQLREQLKQKAKAEKELREEFDKLQGQVRKSTIADALKASGVNAKVADLIPSNVEPTTEAVSKWLEEYGELFGAKTPEGGNGSAPSEPDPQTVSQMTAMSQVSATGDVATTNQPVTKSDLENATTMDEFLALLKRGA